MRSSTRSSVSLHTLALVGVVAAVSACGGGTSGSSSPTGDTTGALSGRTFVSTSVTRNGQPYDLVAGSQVSLSFGEATVSASAGCNTMGGPAHVGSGVLVVDGPLAQTEMACRPALMRQDVWLSDLLTHRPTVRLDGSRLTLATAAFTVELLDLDVAVPDRPVEGTAWRLASLIDGQTVSSVPSGAAATVWFADGTVRVRTGCATGRGTYQPRAGTSSAGTLSIQKPVLSRTSCSPAEEEVLRALTRVLQGSVGYTVEHRSLTLTRGTSGLQLDAPALPTTSPAAR